MIMKYSRMFCNCISCTSGALLTPMMTNRESFSIFAWKISTERYDSERIYKAFLTSLALRITSLQGRAPEAATYRGIDARERRVDLYYSRVCVRWNHRSSEALQMVSCHHKSNKQSDNECKKGRCTHTTPSLISISLIRTSPAGVNSG